MKCNHWSLSAVLVLLTCGASFAQTASVQGTPEYPVVQVFIGWGNTTGNAVNQAVQMVGGSEAGKWQSWSQVYVVSANTSTTALGGGACPMMDLGDQWYGSCIVGRRWQLDGQGFMRPLETATLEVFHPKGSSYCDVSVNGATERVHWTGGLNFNNTAAGAWGIMGTSSTSGVNWTFLPAAGAGGSGGATTQPTTQPASPTSGNWQTMKDRFTAWLPTLPAISESQDASLVFTIPWITGASGNPFGELDIGNGVNAAGLGVLNAWRPKIRLASVCLIWFGFAYMIYQDIKAY